MSVENPILPSVTRDPNEEAQTPAMNEAETTAFLREQGLQPLSTSEWKPGTPFIYVFEELVRDMPDFFSKCPAGRKPSLARVDSPTWMGRSPGASYQTFANEGRGWIDYYAIDAATREPVYIGGGHKNVQREAGLRVRPEALFMPDDTLFPKREGVQ
jgi:hypothetical protein